MRRDKASIRSLLGFDDTWVLVMGIPVVGFLVPILFFNATLKDGLVAYTPELMTSLMFTVTYWLSVRQLFIIMRRRYPGYAQVRKRVVYTVAVLLVVFFIINHSLGWVHENLFPHPKRPGVTDFDYAVASLTIVLLVSAIYEGVYLYYRWRESLVEQERLRRENVESQLMGLRNQVNPHFLFNSLNTLVYMIPEDPGRAVTFVRKLSKVYRYVLEIRDRQLISLGEELQFMESYVFLLKERFGSNIDVRVEAPPAAHARLIVPLSLQLLLENAIKHNIISSEHPLHITVEVDDEAGRLWVRNNLQPKHQEQPSTRVGLQNIRNRYAFFTPEPVEVIDDGQIFAVALPLLNAPVGVAAKSSI